MTLLAMSNTSDYARDESAVCRWSPPVPLHDSAASNGLKLHNSAQLQGAQNVCRGCLVRDASSCTGAVNDQPCDSKMTPCLGQL